MPSVSKSQQHLMGADLGRLRAGKKTRTGMSASQLEDFARGSMKGKPEHVGKGQATKPHTSVGCGHAGKCSCVGSGQRADFLKRSASADRSVGKGQAAKSEAKEERGEVQHERKEMGLIKKLEKMHPPSMLKTGMGQGPARPVIPGIRPQRGAAPPPVNFGDPAMPPYTSGTPRSTRQGPYNTQGQGPPSGRGGRKPRMPKSGPVVHPGKRGKMTT